MHFRYRIFDPSRASREERIRQLLDLFRQLLTHAAGDVDQALAWLDDIAERHGLWGEGVDLDTIRELLERRGTIRRGDGDGGFTLTPAGEKGLRQQALKELFGTLRGGGAGDHRSRSDGSGGERLPEVRPFAFGDDLWSIAANETLKNAVKSSIARDGLAGGIAVGEDDLAVHETEANTSCATALLVDCSHSMVLYGEDRMTPARQVAMGLVELIRTKFPKDRLHVIAFGNDAVEVPLDRVPYLNYGRFYTNTKAALRLGRELLMRSRYRQILMITDGKPTVLDEGGRRMIDAGWLNERIVNRTLDEAVMCRRKNIPITTFMMTDDPTLVQFVEELTELNRGRAYYTALDRLGGFLLVDYIRNRKRTVR